MTQIVKPAFSAGILSAELTSSVELEKHRYGLKECTNMIVDALGGAKNRPGTQYIDDAYSSAVKSRLIPFQFNVEQGYVLEFSNLKMRILKDGALVGAPTEVVSPYATADLPDLDVAQSADTLYIASGTKGLYKATRTSDTAWTISEGALQMNGPYRARVAGDDEITITATPSSAPATWTLTASAALFGDVENGDCFRLGFPVPGDDTATHWQWFLADTPSSSTVMTAVMQDGESNIISGGYDILTYQSVINPIFKNGITFWDDRSNANSTVTYRQSNGRMLLTDGATGSAFVEQAVLLRPNVKYVIHVTAPASTGATPTLNLQVGTTSLGVDVLASTTSVATNTFIPPQEVVYVSLNTSGSTDGDTYDISGVQIYEYGDGTTVEAQYSTNEWALGEFNATRGYAKKVIFSDQRLILANSDSNPQTLWVSRLGDFENFSSSTPSVATDSFSFNPPTPQINGILSMILYNGLKVLTSDAIWDVFASSGGAITPTDVNIRVDGAVGSLDLQPIVAGNSLLITPRGMAALSEITSSFETSGFVPRDVSILARDLFDDRRIVRWAFAKNPDSVVWCVLDTGVLLGFTYVKEYYIWAWHKHTTPLGEGFMDVTVIPNSSDDNIDDVYFVINRAAVGATANYYLETLNKRITSQTAAYGLSSSGTPYDYKFLDSALTLDSPATISGATQADPVVITATGHPFLDGEEVRIQNILGMTELNDNLYTVANKAANTFELTDSGGVDIDGTAFTAYLANGEARKMVLTVSGLGHLEGEAVVALADGSVRDNLTVSSGAVTLPQTASFIHVGLSYTSEIETVDLEIMADDGTTQGKLKSITKAEIYLKDSTGEAEFSTSNRSDTYAPIQFENESSGEDPAPLFTGSKEITFPSNYGKDERIKIRQTEPLPLHIKRIIPDVSFGG